MYLFAWQYSTVDGNIPARLTLLPKESIISRIYHSLCPLCAYNEDLKMVGEEMFCRGHNSLRPRHISQAEPGRNEL